jgi:hypothetical protein
MMITFEVCIQILYTWTTLNMTIKSIIISTEIKMSFTLIL